MTLRLLLIRHGLSSFNRENRIQGRNDLSKLTDEGILQASKAGDALRNIPINSVYSSPLQRAKDTTKELIKECNPNLTPIFDNGLLEIDLAPWSGLTIEEVKEKFPNLYTTWKESPEELTISRSNGSTYKPIQELLNQAEQFLQKIFTIHKPELNQTILLVGHNAILRCLILKMLNEPSRGFTKLKLDNSSISIFNINLNNEGKLDFQIETLNSTAHLEPKLPSKSKYARVILVRHGETDWNKEGRFQGQIDIPLNENGRDQASAAGDLLKNIQIDKAYSSSMSRPLETAKIILRSHPKIEVQQKEELIEIGHGMWEGKLETEIASEWGDLLNDWKKSPEKVQMPQGENLEEVSLRVLKCWESICNNLSSNETALVVAHDAVNKTLLCHLLGLKNSDIWKIKQGNGGVTIIDIIKNPRQTSTIITLNIISHLGGVIDKTAQGAL